MKYLVIYLHWWVASFAWNNIHQNYDIARSSNSSNVQIGIPWYLFTLVVTKFTIANCSNSSNSLNGKNQIPCYLFTLVVTKFTLANCSNSSNSLNSQTHILCYLFGLVVTKFAGNIFVINTLFWGKACIKANSSSDSDLKVCWNRHVCDESMFLNSISSRNNGPFYF